MYMYVFFSNLLRRANLIWWFYMILLIYPLNMVIFHSYVKLPEKIILFGEPFVELFQSWTCMGSATDSNTRPTAWSSVLQHDILQ